MSSRKVVTSKTLPDVLKGLLQGNLGLSEAVPNRSIQSKSTVDEETEEEARLLDEDHEAQRIKLDMQITSRLDVHDSTKLCVLEIVKRPPARIRQDMNRLDLLEECRRRTRILQNEGACRDASHQEESLKGGLQLRDIHCMQGVQLPAFLVRRGAMVLNLLPITAIIIHDTLYMLVKDGSDKWLVPLLERLEKESSAATARTLGNISQTSTSSASAESHESPVEFAALESILVVLVAHYAEIVQKTRQEVSDTLKRKTLPGAEADIWMLIKRVDLLLEGKTSPGLFKRIWMLKKRVDQLLGSVRSIFETLEEVQGDDGLLGLMYHSAMLEDPGLHASLCGARGGNTERAEVLLDTYGHEFENMCTDLGLLSKEIDGKEELVEFELDYMRNQLMLTRAVFTVATLWVTCATIVAGLGGVNLHSGAEQVTANPYGFYPDPAGGNATGGAAQMRGAGQVWIAFVAGSAGAAVAAMVGTVAVLWAKNILNPCQPGQQ